jgi:hypothetical protein
MEGSCPDGAEDQHAHGLTTDRRGSGYRAGVIMVAAVVAYVLLAALAVFQIALIAGAPLGHLAWGGKHRVLPRRLRIGSAVSVLLYAVFAWIISAGVARATDVGDYIYDTPPGVWVLTAYFGLGIVVNAISRSVPERVVMTPVVAILFACCLVIALA